MRTVASPWLDKMTASREVKARVTFRDTRLIFAPFTPTEAVTPTVSDVGRTDGSLYGTGFLRIAVASDDKLWYQYVSDPTAGVWPNWVDSGITVHNGNKPGVRDGRIWYQKNDGALRYVDFNGTDLDASVLIGAGYSIWRTAFAPINATEAYIYFLPSQVDAIVNQCRIARLTTGEVFNYFPGAIYTDATDVYRFDAVKLNGISHIYYIDDALGRVRVITEKGNIFSESQPLIPIDIVDTDNFVMLEAATVIDGRVFVTGRLKRDQGLEMDIYTIGPDHYTMGRDLFIVSDAEYTSETHAKLYLVGDVLYHIGFNFKSKADATLLVGNDLASKKLLTSEIMGFNTDFVANRASGLDLEIKSDLTHAAIRRGSEVELEIGIGDGDGILEWTPLLKYGIDGLSTDTHGQGSNRLLTARSLAIKRLSQWTSDAFYDYWSQAKQSSDPAPLSQLIVTSGQWEADSDQAENPLTLSRLNEDGILYTVAKASRGSIIRAKFKKDSSVLDYEPSYGVILNYYRENRQEAALRLDKEVSDIQDDEFGHNGIKVLWGEGGIYVWNWSGGEVDVLLKFAPLAIPNGTWHWIEARFSEGHIRVLYRLDEETDWTQLIDYRYSTNNTNVRPWMNEDRGRGGVFIRNLTTFSLTPGFTSTSDIIPIDSASDFPTSETVIVDDEQIDYTGKATAAVVPAEMDWAEGHTFPAADHNNSLWDNILIFEHQWNQSVAGEHIIGKDKLDGAFVGQSFRGPFGLQRIDKVRVPIKKTGTPTDLYCHFVFDAFDNGANPDKTQILFYTKIAHTVVGTDYDWAGFDFLADGILANGYADFFIDPTYKRSYWIYLSTMPFDDFTNYNAYHSNVNYYTVDLDEQVGLASRPLGLMLIWSTGVKWDRYHDLHGPNDAIMPFQIIGKSPAPFDAFEIYIDTADNPVVFTEDEFTNMALVCTEGPGAGQAYKIVYYDSQAPKQWVPKRSYTPPDTWQDHVNDSVHGDWVDQDKRRIFVSKRPSALGEGSKFVIKPSLTLGERAVNDTELATHGPGTVSIYRDVSVDVDLIEFYSSEMDMRLEDMAFELVRKAGVLDFSSAKDITGNQVFSGAGWRPPVWLSRRNLICKFEMPSLDVGEEVGVICRTLESPSDIDTVTQGYMITLDDIFNINFWKFTGGSWVLQQVYPMMDPPIGTVTISVQGTSFSVWVGGKFITAFYDSEYDFGTKAGLLAFGTVTVNADWSALDILVDNFVLDMGRRGAQLLNGLIGPKRIFYLDDQSGGLRMGRMRATGAADFTANDFTVEKAETEFDAAQISRVRAEGAEIAEVVDYAALRSEGNLFALANATEANDYWETYDEALLILAEAKSSANVVAPTGLIDPRIEPQDIVTIGADTLIIDRVRVNLTSNENDAIMDMSAEGRDASV